MPWLRSQRSGLGTKASASSSPVTPGAIDIGAAEEIGFTICPPFGPRMRICSERLTGSEDWLMAVLRTWTVADFAETIGVVTNVPHGAICVASVVTRRTWRLIPAPEYQREAGCSELSTRTAMTFVPGRRCGVSS